MFMWLDATYVRTHFLYLFKYICPVWYEPVTRTKNKANTICIIVYNINYSQPRKIKETRREIPAEVFSIQLDLLRFNKWLIMKLED